jgi:TolB-like protein
MRKHSLKVLWLIAMLVLTSSAFAQRIAILNFNAGVGINQNDVDGISSIFNTYFSPKGAEIIERTRVDRLLQEQEFQRSKFTTSDMVKLGKILNVSFIVVGDVNITMGQYNVDIRVVNVQTGTVVAKDGISFNKNTSYRGTMQQLGIRLSNKMEAEIEKINIESKPGKPESSGGVGESKSSGKKLPIAKQDISLHGSMGCSYRHNLDDGFSIGLKYKYKPFDKYDIRLLGEIGTAFTFKKMFNSLSIIPIMAGINYEYRFTESTSIWTDLALGRSIPLSERRQSWSDDYYSSFEPGFALSPEIGIRYNDFSFSFKFIYSLNGCSRKTYSEDGDRFIIHPKTFYDSHYFLFQVGYHF